MMMIIGMSIKMKSETWLLNPVVSQPIYIDIDVQIVPFIYSFHYTILKMKIKRLMDIYGEIQVYIRESSSGNTHVKLEFNTVEVFEGLTFYDSLLIRGFLGDDSKRIRADIQRFYEMQTTEETDRIFDVKIKDNRVFNAGIWKHLNPIWEGKIPQ